MHLSNPDPLSTTYLPPPMVLISSRLLRNWTEIQQLASEFRPVPGDNRAARIWLIPVQLSITRTCRRGTSRELGCLHLPNPTVICCLEDRPCQSPFPWCKGNKQQISVHHHHPRPQERLSSVQEVNLPQADPPNELELRDHLSTNNPRPMCQTSNFNGWAAVLLSMPWGVLPSW
ncbi:hypothetical protein VTI74DRAFT_425 [Chaetomium olivicolor]